MSSSSSTSWHFLLFLLLLVHLIDSILLLLLLKSSKPTRTNFSSRRLSQGNLLVHPRFTTSARQPLEAVVSLQITACHANYNPPILKSPNRHRKLHFVRGDWHLGNRISELLLVVFTTNARTHQECAHDVRTSDQFVVHSACDVVTAKRIRVRKHKHDLHSPQGFRASSLRFA